MSNRPRRSIVLIPAIVVAGLGLYGGATLGQRLAGHNRLDDYGFFDEIIEVQQLLMQRYVDRLDDNNGRLQKLREGAIKGMVEALNDPYTIYVPASDKQSFNKDLTGEYVGIGASVNISEGYLNIVSPLEDSPAYRAGLMADDKVTEIDGQSTKDRPIDECIDRLMGEPGTKVTLTVDRKGEKLTFEITRDRIKTRSVKGYHRSGEDPSAWDYVMDPQRGIAYVRLTQFTPKCSDELLAALKAAGADSGKVKGLVLDLRFNPGGLLDEAEKIADFFLEDGVIVSTRGRAYPEVVRKAEKPGTLPTFPMVVLLNGQSASESEVLAGALVENDRAIAVGQRSFGKGSVQSVVELPSGQGSELKITEQGYYLPSGRSLTRKDDSASWGVDPTEGFYVPVTDDELIAMFEVRRQQEILHAKAGATRSEGERWNDPDWVLTALKDKQLAAAVRAVQQRVDTGAWQPTGEKGSGTLAISSAELTRLRQFHERLSAELERTEKRMDAIERAEPGATAEAPDLWPDAVEVRGGTIEVRDKSGKVIAVLDITGGNLERWLAEADVKKRAATENSGADAAKPETGKPADKPSEPK